MPRGGLCEALNSQELTFLIEQNTHRGYGKEMTLIKRETLNTACYGPSRAMVSSKGIAEEKKPASDEHLNPIHIVRASLMPKPVRMVLVEGRLVASPRRNFPLFFFAFKLKGKKRKKFENRVVWDSGPTG